MPLHYEDDRVGITRVVVGPMVNNVFVLRCTETGESVLIDAADEPGVLLPLCEELQVGDVLTTHGHRDHIQAVPAVRAAGHRVGVAEGDAGMLPAYDFLIDDGAVIEVGR
ncbi:MAG: MBL fold metallo-hydrolase, partial [Actinomycetota bacterium]|nr:MBL fold metallo-hydrolase [Actinomycetota bacterium]